MALADLKNLPGQMQQAAKSASVTLTQRFLRLISGFFVALVLALITQELTQSGTLILLFLTTLLMLIVYRLLRSLSILQIFIFDVICILIAVSLRMYIMLAP
jgi:hypothetical protein